MAYDYDAYDAILHHIFKQTQGDAWFKPAEENVSTGVCLRVEPGNFRTFPYENVALLPFETAVRALNPEVAVKLRSASVHSALANVTPDQHALFIDPQTRIQILDNISELASAEKEQCAAFIRDERVLVVWSNDRESIIEACQAFEDKLIKLVWRVRPGVLSTTTNTTLSSMRKDSLLSASANNSRINLNAFDHKSVVLPPELELRFKDSESFMREKDLEDNSESIFDARKRPVRLFAPLYVGVALAASTIFVSNGLSTLIREAVLDGNYIRLALAATIPPLFCIALFFAYQIVTTLSYCIGPVAQYRQNSRFYSAIPPPAPKGSIEVLPHVTIQMPVYKESLEQTITPSIESLKKAMLTYARQGGTSSIFVCDDGMQLLSPEEREARLAFYATHGIGWVARPPHNPKNGFIRAGRFKKASNMNYGLALSLRMEEIIMGMEKSELGTTDEDNSWEDKALRQAVAETGPEHVAWAGNGRAIRMGEIILLVDSDTQVPVDCLRDAARELAQCPEVSIIQHESDVMQVAHHYFENGIAYFTRRVNHCISMACANGEVAPFVGHNAFIRWSAMQEAAFVVDDDRKRKWWSENNVSEDFDMAMRMQRLGYTIRWSTYSNGGFKEGVSLTCDDELNRWMKYAYGCNELMFNPMSQWLRKGPITSKLHNFLWSNGTPFHYKISILSYMFSYYGIAAAITLSILNYIILGYEFAVDGFYMHSFEIWLATTIVFLGAGNIGITLLEYRLNKVSLLGGLWENARWIPFFFFFFGGLSLHLSGAILAHLFGYNMTWSATVKEVEMTNFFKEFPRILRRFWLSFIICFLLLAGIIVVSLPFVPLDWRITGFTGWAVILPVVIQTVCHILFPIVLNPWLMIFSY